MPAAGFVSQAVLDEAIFGVLAKRFELPVAGTKRRVDRDDHRPRDQPVEGVEGVVLVNVAHRGDGVDERAAREDGHPVEQRAFAVVEERVRPFDRGLQGSVAFHTGASAAQEAKPIIEPGRDLVRCHRPAARGGELDRERDAVEAGADLVDRGEGRIVEQKVRACLTRSRAEQADRVRRQ
jgi:hypothetical protein